MLVLHLMGLMFQPPRRAQRCTRKTFMALRTRFITVVGPCLIFLETATMGMTRKRMQRA